MLVENIFFILFFLSIYYFFFRKQNKIKKENKIIILENPNKNQSSIIRSVDSKNGFITSFIITK
jgi:hypothetical protein